MDRFLSCALLLAVVVLHCSSLSIQRKTTTTTGDEEKKTVAEDATALMHDKMAEEETLALDQLSELRKNYGMLLDRIIKRRSHPFGWGLRRYKTRKDEEEVHPFGYSRFGTGDVTAERKRSRDHPFGFSITRNNRYGDHPFGFGLGSKKDAGMEKDAAGTIPSNTKAFHGRRRDMGLDEMARQLDEDFEAAGAKKVSEWLDEKMMREE